MLAGQLVQPVDDVIGGDGASDVDGEALSRELIDDVHVGSSLRFNDQNVGNEQQSQYVNRRFDEFQYGHSRGE